MEPGVWLMTDHIADGWAWLSNGTDYLKVFVENIFWTPVFMPEMEHYEGGINIGLDLSKFWIVVKLNGVWLDTNTKYNNFVIYMKSWQQANTLQVEIVRNTSSNKEKLDGTNTIFPVLMSKGLIDINKMPEDQEKYRIDSIPLEQRGTAS